MSLSASPASLHGRVSTLVRHVSSRAPLASDDEDTVFSQAASYSSSSYTASCSSSPSLSGSTVLPNTSSKRTPSTRRNDHLAVLLPNHLWKRDSQAAYCDVFHCRKTFSLFERRHHCRKCGGIFCGQCSAQSMPLLDTSNLNFFHPPRNVPISTFESPTSPIVSARVCFECWDQVNGGQSPRTPELLSSSPVPFVRHLDSSNSSVISTPPDRISHSTRAIIRRSETLPEFPQIPPPSPVLPDDEELGELATYPLRHSSALCKRTGGGRWCPKKVTVIEGHRIPGCKAQYEIDLEQEEEELRRLKLNPVFKDGEFQYRVPREIEPQSLRGVGPFVLSTF